MPFRHSALPILLLAAAVLALAVWAYAPGLHGGFLFDDFGNLPAIGATGPIDTWPTFWRYITSGTADPTGRPLALLSFLVDARDWPAAPYPFKRTNLFLHLFNGILLALLLRRLGRELFRPALQVRSDLAAVLGSALWLLHPLLVSTTLYIVQREAMLPASFTLLGLCLWLHGRHAILEGQPRRGFCWIAAGLGGCTVLGILSKANGLLLPALALVVECVWLRQCNDSVQRRAPASTRNDSGSADHRLIYRRSMLLFAWLPSLMLSGYLLRAGWNGFAHGTSALRSWTLGQRLLTEPRVLTKYMDLLWLPRPFTPGLFNDHVQVSTSLWSPGTTLPALLAVLGLIAGACCLRRKFPATALAILFYFVGLTMESTTLQLELYFEHRNYLPAMLMFWPLALWICGVNLQNPALVARPTLSSTIDPTSNKSGSLLKGALAVMLLTSLALMTHARAALWGNNHDQGLLWAQLNPGSPRAQANAALLEMAGGAPQQAVARLIAALPTDPDQVQLSFNLIGAHCMLGNVPVSDFQLARRAIAHTRDPGTLLVHWFDSSIAAAIEGRCHGLDLTALDTLLDAGLANQKLSEVSGRHQDLLYLKGHIALARHDSAAALSDFNAALDLDVRPDAALNQAALLGSAGYPREGLSHLEYYRSVQARQEQPAPSSGMPWLHAWILHQQDYWPKETERLRNTLQQDAQANAKGNE